jgi:hypothetical protein
VEPCDTVQLGMAAQPHLAYAWTTDPPGAWLSCTDCPQPLASPDTLTRYYVTLTDTTLPRTGCEASTHKVRLRFARPATSPDTVLCAGDTAWLRARVATPGSTFTWQPGGLTGGTVAVAPTATTVYTVTAQRPGCAITTTDTVRVVVLPDTAAVCNPVSRPVAAGRLQLRVYPNPTRGTLTVETPQPGHWHLTTALGQTLHRLDLPAGRTEVDLGSCPLGLYLGRFTPHNPAHPPVAVKVQKE